MVTTITKTFQYGDYQVTLETGKIARQATGSVTITVGDTVLLATAVGKRERGVARDFFPLTVNYQEKAYAGGKIPGGYFKREGRPSEKETLISRLIDRPLRPMFPKGFNEEVQIVVTLLSLDEKVPADIPAIIASSAALAVSGLPFNGPVAAARVGYKDGQYLLNPAEEQLAASDLDLVVAGTQSAVLMVESQARELSEAVMLGAVMFGHQQMQVVIQAISEFANSVSSSAWEWEPAVLDVALVEKVKQAMGTEIAQAYAIQDKMERRTRLEQLLVQVVEQLTSDENDLPAVVDVEAIFAKIEKDHVRNEILSGKPRIDGRDTRTVRPITIETGLLPRAHGSALFTRGETQVLAVATLGSERDAQLIDDIGGEYKDNVMLHYNFPPYSVGEVGQIGSPKRREIGHGKLAKRGLMAVLPDLSRFPYVLRLVSEVTESNGSSSMATICGCSLALMDAGVPIKAPVAGVAMGLIKEQERFAVLTDILGDEDHLGDMDFKVAGTEKGVTALQMDIKIDGITEEIMSVALEQAREGRLHILGIMNSVLPEARQTISSYAPRIITMRINPDKIREVIGKGGAVIRDITESTGTTIDITDDGVVKIYAVDAKAGDKARKRIEMITAEVEIGKIYEGKVAKILDFGAFVNLFGDKTGLVHISQISNEHVHNIYDYVQEGQTVRVKVLEIDRQGRIRLSMKELEDSTPIVI